MIVLICGTARLLEFSVMKFITPFKLFSKSSIWLDITSLSTSSTYVHPSHEYTLYFKPASWEHGQDYFQVTNCKRGTYFCLKFYDLFADPLPSCSHFIAGTKHVLNILYETLSPTSLVGTEGVLSSFLLE